VILESPDDQVSLADNSANKGEQNSGKPMVKADLKIKTLDLPWFIVELLHH
jgi:hypothetical protein